MDELQGVTAEEIPDGWTRKRSVEEKVGATAVFEHESGDWRITIRRYDPGRADGKQVCREVPEDRNPVVAPLFKTKLRSLTREKPSFLRIQTDDMDSPDRLPLKGREVLIYPDPDGAKLVEDLKQKEQWRREIEAKEMTVYEELREQCAE